MLGLLRSLANRYNQRDRIVVINLALLYRLRNPRKGKSSSLLIQPADISTALYIGVIKQIDQLTAQIGLREEPKTRLLVPLQDLLAITSRAEAIKEELLSQLVQQLVKETEGQGIVVGPSKLVSPTKRPRVLSLLKVSTSSKVIYQLAGSLRRRSGLV